MAGDVLAARLQAQQLSGAPAATAVEVVERLLAVQGQDPRGARLAIRARSEGLHARDVDAALEDRALVITWVNRGTLHLIRSEDYAWLHALTTPSLHQGNARRLEQEGVSPEQADRGVAVIEKAVADGPVARPQLRELLLSADVPVAGQALVHVLMLASLRSVVVRGPMLGREHAYVLVRDWLGESPKVDRDTALGELARRYLAGHGPATERDLANWAGLPARDARKGLAQLRLVEKDGLVDLPGRNAPPPLPGPRLLGPFDPVLHGWASREWILGKHTELVTVNGLFRAFAMVRGKAVGTWGLTDGKVTLVPFGALGKADSAALLQDSKDVARFLDY